MNDRCMGDAQHPAVRTRRNFWRGLAGAGLAILLLLAPAIRAADGGDNFVLPVVPAPAGGVKLDGDLADWDLSGKLFSCYDAELMRDTHSVYTAAMYDARGLYLAFHFKDKSPLRNLVDPVNQPGCGWRNDCVQLRIWADSDKPLGPQGGRLAHIDAYYFTAGKQPVAYLQYNDMSKREGGFEGKIAQAVGQGIEMAFRADADGKGYVQEMLIEWKLLRRDGSPYKAGESLRMGMEFMWDNPSNPGWPEHRYADLINKDRPQREFFWSSKEAWGEVKFLDKGNLAPTESVAALSALEQRLRAKYATQGVVEIAYDLPADQRVTLVVEKPDGTRVRNLIADFPRYAGRNVDYWDGADDEGNPVAAGEYRVRGLTHGNFDLLYQFQYGTPGTPPWETSDGKGDWLSDHARPVGVASDGAWTYLSHHMSEGGSTVIGLDATGQRQWGIGRIAGGPLAVIGKDLFMLTGGGHPTDWGISEGEIHLMKIDARAGRLANFSGGKSDLTIAEFPKDRAIAPRPFMGTLVQEKSFDADWYQREAVGLAAAGGALYASLYYENQILKIDPASGEVTGKFALEKPAGLAGDAAGNLYAVSGRQVVRLGADGKFTPFLNEGLRAPVALACDAEGNVFVSEWADQMCVKVFTPAGKPLRTVGKPGGRALRGKYDPTGMFLPVGLAVDGKNQLWAAEFDFQPKRYSVWNAGGALVREYCGPTWYGATECGVNTLDPKQAFCMGSLVDLDWEKGLWRVAATLWRPVLSDELFGPLGEHGVFETFERAGKRYVVFSRSSNYLCIAELSTDGARPLMARGKLGDMIGDWKVMPENFLRKMWDDPAQVEWVKQRFPQVLKGGIAHPHRDFGMMVNEARRLGKPARDQFLWTDVNGDGRVQDAEMKLFLPEEANGLVFGSTWRSAVDGQQTQYLGATVRDPNDDKKRLQMLWRWPVREWNAAGAPVYELKDVAVMDQRPAQSAPAEPILWANGAGDVIVNHKPLRGYNANGARWSYPNNWPGVHGSHTAPKDMNGLLIGPLKQIGSANPGGEAGELFCLNGNMGKAFLFTIDGLYVGSLFRDCRSAPDALPDNPERGVSINRTSAGSEWFGGEFFRNRYDGKIYLGSAGRNCELLSEVTGLDTIRRLPAMPVALDEAKAAQAKEFLAARQKEQAGPRVLAVAPLKNEKGGVPALHAFNWKDANTARWSHDEEHAAEASLGYDSEKLYLAFRNVKDANPFVNGGKMKTRLFKTGDAALLELRVNADDKRKEVLPGDLRLLFSIFEGKPLAILYRYKALPGETAQAEEFASPVQTVKVEVVRVLDDAQIAVDRQGGGYQLRAAVPLKDLGFRPQAGKSFLADFGIVYSDAKGTLNELRMNWANRETGLVADLPGETQIKPANWGTLVIKDKP